MALVPTYCSNCRDETETGADLCSSCAQEALSGALAAMNYHTLRAQVGDGPWEVVDNLGYFDVRGKIEPDGSWTTVRLQSPHNTEARATALCKLLNGET